MKRRGWEPVRRTGGEVVGWKRKTPAMALYAAEGLLGRGWWGNTSAHEPAVKDLASPDEAAASAETAGRKLLAKSLRLLLPTSPALTAAYRATLATDLRGLTPEARRELLRQLLREVEKGGGA